jgi:hypothetical protein
MASKPVADWMKWWLVGSTAVIVGSLALLAIDIVMGFAYFGQPKWPLWFSVLGVLAVLGVALGFAGFLGLMAVAGYKARQG